jgi:3-oxoadipate enol-lactonase
MEVLEISNGVSLEYETKGNGDAVLFIHGAHVADSFLPLMKEAALADRYRLIRYRRRGFAGSAAVPDGFTIEQQAQDALALANKLGVERAHVVGHSYSGDIALQMALDAPDFVRSLVLLEPAIMMVPGAQAFVEAVQPAVDSYVSGDVAGAVDKFLSVVGGPDWKATVAGTIPGGPEQAERDGRTFFEVEFPSLEKWGFDAAVAKRIDQPVLYVIGTDTDPLFEEGKELLKSWLPQMEELVIEGANHLLQIVDPEPIAKGIAEFLGRQPVSVSRSA